MSDNKKKRLSMLDNLAAASPPAPTSLMKTNRPLRAARDAVDGHKVWDLNPQQVIDTRVADRLDHQDIVDLRDSIEATGQSVPILVRRHPSEADQYLLVYGRRRLEAIRSSNSVKTVRALIANIDETTAVEAQISENMGRRDLSFIEKALFAQELIDSGFGNQTRVAEVLTVSKSSISMALAIVSAVGPDLIRTIGAAQGIGRPRWDDLARAMEDTGASPDHLIAVAERAHGDVEMDLVTNGSHAAVIDPSVAAFEAVLAAVTSGRTAKPATKPAPSVSKGTALKVNGVAAGRLSRSRAGIKLEVGQGGFADWLADNAQTLIENLHAQWRAEDKKSSQ